MLKLLKNQWVRLGAVSTLAALVGSAIAATIALSVSSGPSTADHVSLTSGGVVRARTTAPGAVVPPLNVISDDLPLTAAEAIAAGWIDPILCDPGRGRFFRKGPESDPPPYFLMYDSDGQLIGVYLFVVSESEMPPPWAMWDELIAGGLPIIDHEHWSLIVYFEDSTGACKLSSEGTGTGAYWNYGESAVKSTPTPYVAPTPTPTAGSFLESASARMTSVKSLSFTLTIEGGSQSVEGSVALPDQINLQLSDPKGADISLPFRFEDLGMTLAGIARAIQDPADTTGAWIDNVRSRGVSGTVAGQQLIALIPSAVSDAKVTLTMWVDAQSMVRRVRIEGPVVPDDPPDVVRVLDVWDFD